MMPFFYRHRALLAVFLLSTPQMALAAAEAEKTPEINLTVEQQKLIDLKTEFVSRGTVSVDLVLNGEVSANQDRTVIVMPKAPGLIREVGKRLGDRVRAGEALATIESPSLSEAQAAYLTARSKANLAQAQLGREEGLWRKKISSEQDYLLAKQAVAETTIDLNAAQRKLSLLGVDLKSITDSPTDQNARTHIPLIAPIEGTVIEKKISAGDQVTTETAAFCVANLTTVWIIASVFEKDIKHIQIGQDASVTLKSYPDRQFEGHVSWISDVMDEKTRTLKIRVELGNPDFLLKPGAYGRVTLSVPVKEDAVIVPFDAVQRHGRDHVVFVSAGEGKYLPREVKLGARSQKVAEVVEGLEPGAIVVTDGSFLLKSELEKENFAGDEH